MILSDKDFFCKYVQRHRISITSSFPPKNDQISTQISKKNPHKIIGQNIITENVNFHCKNLYF